MIGTDFKSSRYIMEIDNAVYRNLRVAIKIILNQREVHILINSTV